MNSPVSPDISKPLLSDMKEKQLLPNQPELTVDDALPVEKTIGKGVKARATCNDFVFAILFLCLFGVIVYYGLDGLSTLRNIDLCSKVPGPNPSYETQLIYDNCFSYLIRGDFTATGRCIAYAITILANTTTQSIPVTPARLPLRVMSELAIPPIFQPAYDNCLIYFVNGSDNAIQKCYSYALANILLPADINEIYGMCVQPVINRDTNALDKCRDYAFSKVPAPVDLNISNVYANCILQNPKDTEAAKTCIRNQINQKLAPYETELLMNTCINYAVNRDPLTVKECLYYAMQKINPNFNTTYYPYFEQCVAPIIQLNPGAVPACFQQILIRLDISSDQIFDTLISGIKSLLGPSNAQTLNSGCFQGIFTDPLSSPSCFVKALGSFNGIQKSICYDLQARSLEALEEFYSSFTDYVLIYKDLLIEIGGYIIALGIGLTLVWMLIIAHYAKTMIKFTIIMTLLNLLFMAGLNFAFGNIPGGVILLVYLLIKIIWYFWVRNQIIFASIILSTSLKSLHNNLATFFISAIMFLGQAVWCVVFLGAYYKLYNNNVAVVFLILCFFWTIEVLKNILAVTISGVISSWYFYKGTDKMPAFTTTRAFLRSLSFYFGSICFGSLIVAALKTFRYFFRKAESTKKMWLKALIMCFLKSFMTILQTFNMYAFVQVATYSKSYCRSAKDTFALLRQTGLAAIVNDDLVEGVLSTVRFLGALLLAGLAGILCRSRTLPWSLTIAFMIVGLFFGFALLSMCTVVVEIACATLFVCFAQEPEALLKGQPELHTKLVEAWEKRHSKLPDFMTKAKPIGDLEGQSNSSNLKPLDLNPQNFAEHPLKKYGKRKWGHHMRTLRIEDGKLFENSPKAFVYLSDITIIKRGLASESLNSYAKQENANRCFVIVTEERELSLEAENANICDMWINKLNNMVAIEKKAAKKFKCIIS